MGAGMHTAQKRIVTDNERLKRSEWNHKKQLENEVTKRNR